MTRRILLLSALFFGLWPVGKVPATEPVTYKEIAMLLRNGEDQQFIINDTTHRKLLQPLSQEEMETLLSLHASPALLSLLRDPATVAAPDAAAAYAARVAQQKQQALEEERLAAQPATQAHLQQQPATLAKLTPGSTPAAPDAITAVVGKPINLKFTAADGTPIDLEKLRGKVVLIDFWATWCGPCMKEVPNVVAAYNQYHGKGFEIVGISLDKDKDKMLKTTAQRGMTWPQYFDGKGWSNEISSQFNVRSIPAMWLVNKKGIVVTTTNARGHLDQEIPRLLAE